MHHQLTTSEVSRNGKSANVIRPSIPTDGRIFSTEDGHRVWVAPASRWLTGTRIADIVSDQIGRAS